MKRIFKFIMLLVLMSTLCGCGNMSCGIGNFTFEKVHIDTYNYSGCFTIEKWYDNSTGIEVTTKEAGSLYLSEGTYFLVSGECPFCDHPTEKGGEG